MISQSLQPANLEELLETIRGHSMLLPRGGGTKSALAAGAADAIALDMRALKGITEYEPDEFTFTAWAGTPLHEIESALEANGQYLPFDPPWAPEGATLGGTVAAGVSGPARLRYGGIRDFIIGIRFIDGHGKLIHGGGKVVKNAAGFDLPKLMVGSMGRLGAIVDLTFKVFPVPQARRTLRVDCGDLERALATLRFLARQPLDLFALELEPPGALILRLAGDAGSLDDHARRVGECAGDSFQTLTDDEENAYWQARTSFAWASPDAVLMKIPLTPKDVPDLERSLSVLENEGRPVARRYSVAGNLAWLALPPDQAIETNLAGLEAVVLRGPWPNNRFPLAGCRRRGADAFARHIKSALDPGGRFPAILL